MERTGGKYHLKRMNNIFILLHKMYFYWVFDVFGAISFLWIIIIITVLATINATLFWLQLYEKKYQTTVILIKNSINIYRWKSYIFSTFQRNFQFLEKLNLLRIPIFFWKTSDLTPAIQECQLWKVLLCLKVEEKICKAVSNAGRTPLLVDGNEFLFNKHRFWLWESVLKTL
jgi:hypothetical protein